MLVTAFVVAAMCNGGDTLYRHATTRVFASAGSVYACSAEHRTPRRVASDRGDVTFKAGPLRGNRVVLQRSADRSVRLGWWDQRTGVLRWGQLGAFFVETTGVAADGAMAALLTDPHHQSEQWIAYLCRGRKRLGRPREVARFATGRAEAKVTITATNIRWRTKSGEAQS